MYKRILLAYDGSEAGQKALLDCHEIAQWSQADLTLIAVMPVPLSILGAEGGVYHSTLEASERKHGREVLETGVRKLADAGLSVRGEVILGEAVDEICSCARRIEADLIVVGHQHLDGWAARWWRGSFSNSLIEESPCSVLIVITR